MNPFRGSDKPYLLVVGMTGVKMGDRLVQIGCSHGGRLAAVAAKVGLSGRAVAVVPDDASAARARKGAAQAGVLVEIQVAPPDRLPVDDHAFDVAVVDDTGGLLGTLDAGARAAAIGEVFRALRPGGRSIVVRAAPRSGLGGLLTRTPGGPAFDVPLAFGDGGFKAVRLLADREGLIFFEGIKPRV